jgi:HK97 family phage major capsid protein
MATTDFRTDSPNSTAGILPDGYASLITEPLDAQNVAINASTLIPTDNHRVHIPKLIQDPTASWIAEGAEIDASQAKVDDLVVTPAKVGGLNVITSEAAADTTPKAAELLGQRLAQAVSKNIDIAYFGSKGEDTVRPAGLEDLTGVTAIPGPAAWADLDPFTDAQAAIEALGLAISTFVANPADAKALAKLRVQTGSNLPLLGADPTQPTRRQINGVPLVVSPTVTAGTIWGIPRERAFVVRRNDVDLQQDTSVFFTSDRVAIRATLRVGFAWPQPAAIAKITLTPAG